MTAALERLRDPARWVDPAPDRQELIAVARHQLRAPLAAVLGAAAVLQETAVGQEPQFVAMIERNVHRAQRLVEELTSALGGSAAGTRDPAPVGLRELVQNAAQDAIHGGTLGEDDFALLGSDPAVVLGDRDRLAQVFDNLLANAASHTPPRTPVRAIVSTHGDHVQVLVRDGGHGIPQHEWAGVFEPFRRGAEARLRGTPGTGLGLPVARRIVEEHGGAVEIVPSHSTGTCIRVLLPRA